jgi:MFS family permease
MVSQLTRPRLRLDPLRVPGFRKLFAAQTISEFGNAFHLVALPLLVYQLGGNAGQLGLVVSAYGICRLVTTPLGGTGTDRFGAWWVMMVSDLGRMVLTAALVAVAVSGFGGFVVIGVLAGGIGAFAGLFQPAAWAVTPSLLPSSQLTAGMALISTGTFAAGFAGPGVAGVVVLSVGPAAAFAVDAVTFALSAVLLAAVGAELRGTAAPRRRASGFLALLRQSPLLRAVLVVTAVANLTVGGMTRVALPALATGELGAGAVGLGGLLAAFTGGCLAGGLAATGMTGLRHRGTAAMVAGIVLGLGVLAVPVVGLVGALGLLFVAGAASTVTNVMIVSVVQQGVPRELLGRVMAAIMFCALGLFPVSVAATGFVIDRFGTTSVFLATGLLLVSAFTFGLSRKEITSR